MKARLLKGATLEELRQAVPTHLQQYRSGNFESIEVDDALWFELDREVNESRLKDMTFSKAGDHYEVDNCIVLYDAFNGLTAYEARDERLWAYYVHTHLLEYSRRRWPIPNDDEQAVAHIRRHFFARDKRQSERDNAASRLWWMAHLCARVPDLDREVALEAFLFKSDVRANLVERPTTSQSTEVFGAILEKLVASYNGNKKLFDRRSFRKLMAEVNSIGGFKLIDCFDNAQASNVVSDLISTKLALSDI